MFLVAVCGIAAAASRWVDETAGTIGLTGEWSNKIEVVDVDGDGLLDVVLANGAGYSSPERRELTRIFLNQGAGTPFLEASDRLAAVGYARVTKTRDVDQDGVPDVVIGNAYGDQSRLFLGDGTGQFVDHTADLPQVAGSIGDLEVGDVDDDGDLDLALVDWGPGDALNGNGFARLWLNDGAAHFAEAPVGQLPTSRIGMSWDLELEDVDDDWDLDLLISSKVSGSSFLFRNDGLGTFTDDSQSGMPHFSNNYELEAMDVSGDGFVDLVTINDAPQLGEHLFLNDGAGSFVDGTAPWWPDSEQVRFADDNVEAFLDWDSDGDADFLIGNLGSHDRLMENEGTSLALIDSVTSGPSTGGTLGIAVGDLDGDGRPDIAMSQGEAADPDKVYFASAAVAVDTAPPSIGPVEQFSTPFASGPVEVHARVTDHKTPVLREDFQSVALTWSIGGGAETEVPMTWYGGSAWRASIDPPAGTFDYSVCATDRQGNAACEGPFQLEIAAATTGETDTDTDADADTDTDVDTDTDADTTGSMGDDEGGCGCATGGPSPLSFGLLLALLGLRRARA
jgi:hypothetical protein